MYCRAAFLLVLVLGGCKQAQVRAQQTAVLRFENLGGSNADWQGRALSELLKRRFGSEQIPRSGSPVPGVSSERLTALSAGATRLITGYYTATGDKLDVTAFAEDAATQKLEGPVHVSGSLPNVVAALAQRFGASQTTSADPGSAAVHEFAVASDMVGAASVQHYRMAIQADPKFGPAYIGLMQSDPGQARDTIAAVSRNAASFAKDAEILRTLADSEMVTRQPAEAARHYQQVIALEPANANLRNLLAYAAMYSGDEAGATAAAAEYARLAPHDPNSQDTRGDIEFAFGHFKEAERDYAATPWKAARARLFAGDVAGATAIVEKQPKTAITGYRAAEWLHLTGHPAEGTAAMAAFAGQATQPELRSAAYTQAAIWALLAHDNAHATEWANMALKPSEPSTFIAAALARFLAQPFGNADAAFQGESAGPVRLRAKGLALVLAGRFGDAVPVWKQIYESTDVNDVLPMYLYGFSLLKTGHKEEAAPLLRLKPIPSAGISPSFEALYLPALRQ